MIQLNYRDTRPIYSQIADHLRQQILTGILEEGSRLPSVRDLAGQLSINPNTIQRAYRELELSGFINTVPGKGCFVCAPGSAMTQEQRILLEQFDRTVSQLKQVGIRPEELVTRLTGGPCDA